jgi:type III secretion protein D
VAIEVVNLGSYQAASITATPTLEEPQSRHERQDSFRVVGVSGGALKFVTLSSGEKVFVGGRLPGGFILESIEYNQLILSKNNQRIVYPLKVSK